jgi:hypothetical protein
MRTHQRLGHKIWTLLSVGVLIVGVPGGSLAQQQLVLTTSIGKAEFFEDEPIYLLIRLQNVSRDTAWTFPFNLMSPAVKLSVSRRHGTAPYLVQYVAGYGAGPSWRGESITPGATVLQTMILQTVLGDEWDLRHHLSANHLPPDEYELRLEFQAHWGLRTPPLNVQAGPIVFRIRPRTAPEEREFAALEAMVTTAWDTTRGGGASHRTAAYRRSVISMIEAQLQQQPDDPFLPLLLSRGVYGVGRAYDDEELKSGTVSPRFDPDTSRIVSQLRLAVIERHKSSPGGALLVQAIARRHNDQLAFLAVRLKRSIAGDMALYEMERNQHEQQLRQPR